MFLFKLDVSRSRLFCNRGRTPMSNFCSKVLFALKPRSSLARRLLDTYEISVEKSVANLVMRLLLAWDWYWDDELSVECSEACLTL